MATTPTLNDSLPSTPPSIAESDAVRSRWRGLQLGWSVALLAFVIFVLFGSIPMEAGDAVGETIRVTTLWAQLTGLLERRGLPGSAVILVWGTTAVALAATVCACWLALNARDEPD